VGQRPAKEIVHTVRTDGRQLYDSDAYYLLILTKLCYFLISVCLTFKTLASTLEPSLWEIETIMVPTLELEGDDKRE
jgi:hypothetical protein